MGLGPSWRRQTGSCWGCSLGWLVLGEVVCLLPPPCETVAAVDWLLVVLGLVAQAVGEGVGGHQEGNLVTAGDQGEDPAGEGVLEGGHQGGDRREQGLRRGRLDTSDS